MHERRFKIRRDEDKSTCLSAVTCPTSEREMDELRKEMNDFNKKVDVLMSEIRHNRLYDKAILGMSFLSLTLAIIFRGVM